MGEKKLMIHGKRALDFCLKRPNISCFIDQILFFFYDVFKVPCQSVSTFDFENFDYYHHVSDEFKVMDMDI
jgi:hypothetical protein